MTAKMQLLALCGLGVSLIASAAELVPGNAGWRGKNLKIQPDGGMAVTGLQYIFSKKSLPVQTNQKYRISGKFKMLNGQSGKVIFGVNVLDKQRRTIFSNEVNTINGTETTLAVGCLPDDRVLKVTAAKNWRTPLPYGQVAFKVDDSGKFTDLPNRNLSAFGIEAATPKGSYCEIRLKKPCGKAYPAGTKIRQHHSAGYLFAGGSHTVKGNWQEFSGVISGVSRNKSSFNQWWPGTAFAEIIILANANNNKNATMVFKDLKLTPIK